MTTNQPGSWARQDPRNVQNSIRARVSFDTPGIATGIQIGVLPQNAFITGQWMEIITSFAAGVLTVGTVAAAYDNLMADADIVQATPAVYTPLVAATNTIAAGKAGRALTQAGDTPVFIRLTGAPASGLAEYVIEYEGGFPG